MAFEARDAAYLWDMLEAAESVLNMTRGMTLEQYRADRKTRRAVEREIEIIGEAARGVSESFCDAHAEIPWRKIIALRNILIHAYFGVDLDLVWEIITKDIPELKHEIEKLLVSLE